MWDHPAVARFLRLVTEFHLFVDQAKGRGADLCWSSAARYSWCRKPNIVWRSGMEVEHVRETAVALYTTLADAEAALSELESSGVPYPDIRLAPRTPDGPDLKAVI